MDNDALFPKSNPSTTSKAPFMIQRATQRIRTTLQSVCATPHSVTRLDIKLHLNASPKLQQTLEIPRGVPPQKSLSTKQGFWRISSK